uniref:Ig-like domain-containing protein n=1 Tax=Xiphophorus maculatus TaxID=8083 RepID=M3ZR86_XIPMA
MFASIFLIFGFFNWTFTSADTDVSCQFRTDCILPCSFNVGNEVVIHWILKPGDIQVHSYYYNKDQLGLQNPRYKGRTSLYPEQLGRGNASLRLSNVSVEDEGRYQCYTSTVNGNKETYIQLKVYAPIKDVVIKKLENNLTCSSDGIYPEPKLTWTIGSPYDPPEKPSISRTESQLYSISSSIPYNLNAHHNAATCSITTTKDQKKATLLEEALRNCSATETTVECQSLDAPPDRIVWRFNHVNLILTRRRGEAFEATAGWKKHVKEVSSQGALTLIDLKPEHEGTYTCESINTKETAIATTPLHLVEDNNVSSTTAIVVIIILGAIVLIAVLVFLLLRRRRQTRDNL